MRLPEPRQLVALGVIAGLAYASARAARGPAAGVDGLATLEILADGGSEFYVLNADTGNYDRVERPLYDRVMSFLGFPS